MMPSSVWKPQRAPAFSRAAAFVEAHVLGLDLASRGVDHDDRARDPRGRDLVGHLPRLAHVLESHPEAELLREPQHGQDVVVAVGVEVDHALALEDLDERLQAEVAGGPLRGVLPRVPELLPVLLRLHELLAHEGGRLGPRAREGRLAPRVGAVGHLHAAEEAGLRVGDEEIVDRAPRAELQVEGLAREEVARAGHDVDGGDAPGPRLLEARVAHVDGVESANVGLQGRARVGALDPADVAVGVDQAGHDDLARDVAADRVRRELHVALGPDRHDLSAVHDHDSLRDLGARDRDDTGAHEGVGLVLGRGERCGGEEGGRDRERRGGPSCHTGSP